MTEELQCDFSMLLSQDLIAKVMETYLNKEMLKVPVEVVDLQNTEAGYVFSLKHKPKVQAVKKIETQLGMHIPQLGMQFPPQGEYDVYTGGTGTTTPPTYVGRAKNGKFTKKEVLQDG